MELNPHQPAFHAVPSTSVTVPAYSGVTLQAPLTSPHTVASDASHSPATHITSEPITSVTEDTAPSPAPQWRPDHQVKIPSTEGEYTMY